jgi:hypothetical protein
MPPGLDQLKHMVVLMMENRSFDHMRGFLALEKPDIDGIVGNDYAKPATAGVSLSGRPTAPHIRANWWRTPVMLWRTSTLKFMAYRFGTLAGGPPPCWVFAKLRAAGRRPGGHPALLPLEQVPNTAALARHLRDLQEMIFRTDHLRHRLPSACAASRRLEVACSCLRMTDLQRPSGSASLRLASEKGASRPNAGAPLGRAPMRGISQAPAEPYSFVGQDRFRLGFHANWKTL